METLVAAITLNLAFLLCKYLGCGFKLLVGAETEKAADEGKLAMP